MSDYEICKEDWDRLTKAQRREIYNLVKALVKKQKAEKKATGKEVRKTIRYTHE